MGVETLQQPVSAFAAESDVARPVAVRLSRVRKSFGSVEAVAGVDLDIFEGEFFTMLGPSGSGKTTLLRVIAGFERPDAGVVELAGKDVTRDPPYLRDVNTVFQDYALFPHMNVRENVEYGLRVRRVPRAVRRRASRGRVEDGAPDRARRAQAGSALWRAASARRACRAIVNEPEVLLLDEPLGALDLKLRQEMQLELKRIQREVGITFVYVTHDQEEALTMSDRIAVFNRGRIEQLGAPFTLYEHPETEFVAGFIGVSNVVERDGRRYTVRPEKVRLLETGEAVPFEAHVEEGRIEEVTYLGMVTRYRVALDAGGAIVAIRQNLETAAAEALELVGRNARVAWLPEHAYAIEPASVGGEGADKGEENQ